MKKTAIFLIFCLFFCFNSLYSGGFNVYKLNKSKTDKTNQIIVKFKKTNLQNASNMSIKLQSLSVKTGYKMSFKRMMTGGASVIKLDSYKTYDEINDIINDLKKDNDIEYAEPDRKAYILDTNPNDTYYNSHQWHYKGPSDGEIAGLNLPKAWDITTGASSTVVAVLDTGILTHRDLSESRILQGYDMISDPDAAGDNNGRDNNPTDEGDWCDSEDSSWHGLHVTGTISAYTDNGVGMAGVDWNNSILPVRVLGKCGGYDSDIIDAIEWASGGTVSGVPDNTNPARVINMSLGGSGSCITPLQNAITNAVSRGVAVVVAAGNDGGGVSNHWPANCDGVLTVSALNNDGGLAWYSNYGSNVFISAPGGGGGDGDSSEPKDWIWSLWNNGKTVKTDDSYVGKVGTSMAAPHISGLISLMLGLKPQLTLDEIKYDLRKTARPFVDLSCNTSICGAGMADAYGAIDNLVVSITSSTPNSAINNNTTELSIWGKGFIHGATVKLTREGYNDINCQNINVINLNNISCDMPLTGAFSGKRDLVLINGDGSTATLTDGFEVINDTLSVSSLDPTSGSNNSTVSIKVYGSGFLKSATSRLSKIGFSDILCATSVLSSTAAVCSADLNGAWEGKRDFIIDNGISNFSKTDAFTINSSALNVNSINPVSGYNNNSNIEINVYGSGFKSSTSLKLSKTSFSDITPTSFEVKTSTYIHSFFNILNSPAGKRDLCVKNSDSTYCKQDLFNILDIQGFPYIYSISPTSSLNNINPSVFIYGDNFINGFTIKLKRSNYSDISVSDFEILSSTAIKAVFPLKDLPYGQFDIEITNPNGNSALYKSFSLLGTESNVKIYNSVLNMNSGDNIDIVYNLNTPSKSTVKVYDNMGRFIKTIYEGLGNKGLNEIKWDGRNSSGSKVSNGIYIIMIETPSYKEYKRVVVIK
ncbi:MAG: S8 family serine peptidase [Elusimicrobia bacterium]|nr:S8 family serine peptidase [Elusimicrobiota bacterium]